jgi:hypothetical protein
MSKSTWLAWFWAVRKVVATLWRQILGSDSANTSDRILPTLSAQIAALGAAPFLQPLVAQLPLAPNLLRLQAANLQRGRQSKESI